MVDIYDKKEMISNSVERGGSMKEIVMKIGDVSYPVILEDNETVEAFLVLLPLDISMNELHGNEKYYYFSQDLPSNSVSVKKVEAGDLMLFGNDCLVLFYESFSTNYAYTKIGRITTGDELKGLLGTGTVKIRFEAYHK